MNFDKSGAIYLSNNQESRKTKYLDTRIHFVREYVEDGVIKVKYVKTSENEADPFTKNVNEKTLKRCHQYLVE